MAATHDEITIQPVELFPSLRRDCKAWCFQFEKSESGYLHFQGRLSLKTKGRVQQAKLAIGFNWAHLTPTSTANRDNNFYVMKEETRLHGPWSDKDVVWPANWGEWDLPHHWQAEIIDEIEQPAHDRKINVLIDQKGGIGKSKLVEHLERFHKARYIPAVFEQALDIMGWVMSFDAAPIYLIDYPRSEETKRSHWAAIETIKGGRAFDKRYKGKEMRFDKPHIWIFTNSCPKSNWLTKNRWLFWTVTPMTKRLRELNLVTALEENQ
nr:putative replication associated protein [Crucivirus sp.]